MEVDDTTPQTLAPKEGLVLRHHTNLASAILDLSPNALRLWLHMVYLAQDKNKYDPETIHIKLKEFTKSIGVAYLNKRQLTEIFDCLSSSKMVLKNRSTGETEIIQLLSYVKFSVTDAEYSMPVQLRPYLHELHEKTMRLLLSTFSQLKRMSSMRIYWLLTDLVGRELTKDWTEFITEVTGSSGSVYLNPLQAERRILKPARKEILANTNLGLSFDYKIEKHKYHSKPVSITFFNIKRCVQQEFFPDCNDEEVRAKLHCALECEGLELHEKTLALLRKFTVDNLKTALMGIRVILSAKKKWLESKAKEGDPQAGAVIFNALRDGRALKEGTRVKVEHLNSEAKERGQRTQVFEKALYETLWSYTDWESVIDLMPDEHVLRVKLSAEREAISKGEKGSLVGIAREFLRTIKGDMSALKDLHDLIEK